MPDTPVSPFFPNLTTPKSGVITDIKPAGESTETPTKDKVEDKVEDEKPEVMVIMTVPIGVTAQQKQQITMLASVSGMDSQQQFKFLDQLFKIIE